jgi:hypothetical protein
MAAPGYATETDQSPAQRAALNDAIRMLEPHADHPALGGALEQLRAYLPAGEDELAKGLNLVRGARVAVAKAADEGEIDGLERVVKDQEYARAQREVEHEIAMRDDVGGYRRAMELRKAEETRRRMNFAARAVA